MKKRNQLSKNVVLRNMVAAAGLAMAVMAAPSFAQGAPAGSAFTYQAKITEAVGWLFQPAWRHKHSLAALYY